MLILEHRMAALRMGFDDLLAALYPVTQFRTSLLDGSLLAVNFFSNLILPLWEAKDDKFATARIMRAASPLLSPSALKQASDQFEQLGRAQAAVDALVTLLDGSPSVTFGEVLRNVAETGLSQSPTRSMLPWLPLLLKRATLRTSRSATTETRPSPSSWRPPFCRYGPTPSTSAARRVLIRIRA